MLLTEDRGRTLGVDDCPCGRKGRYFEISGRISKAEVRGCSDTFESAAAARESGASEGVTVLAGTYPPELESGSATGICVSTADTRGVFDDTVIGFLEDLSKLFMKDPVYRQYPEIYSLGFWCRRAHIEKIRRDYFERKCDNSSNCSRSGRGLTLHIAPSNMPTMFAYSWITSLLAGNPNIVRLSERSSDITEAALRGIDSVLSRPGFEELKKQNAFISFPRGHKALEYISDKAKARIIWGGDETVRSICSVPKADGCIDITFPDKYSAALFRMSDFGNIDEKELKHLAHLFYNDTLGADQNACSSPRTVFWLNDFDGGDAEKAAEAEAVKEKWWTAFAEEAKNYDLQPWIATEKYRTLCRMYATHKGLGTVRRWGNRLYVVPAENNGRCLTELEARFGIFYEMNINSLEEMMPYMSGKIQTIVSSSDQAEIYDKVRSAGCEGVDRVVAIGEALDFNTIWDRKDLVELLSCTSLNETKTT